MFKYISIILLLIVTLSSKEITIKSDDGFELFAKLEYPTIKKEQYPIALFAHQFGADHSIWNGLAKNLRDKGYATLNVDLRGHGKSIYQDGKENSIINVTSMEHIGEAIEKSKKKVKFENITLDLVLWLDYLSEIENINMEKLALIGSSLGAGAILPLALDYEPKVIIAISPGGSDKEAIKDSISIANTSILFISGKNDPLNAQDRALTYSKQAMRGTNLTISSSGHGTVLLPFIEDYIYLFLDTYNK